MKNTLRAGGLVLMLLVPAMTLPGAHATPSPERRAAAGTGYRCVIDTFGRTVKGRIKYRRTVNAHVTVSRTSSSTFRWKPLSWGLVSSNRFPDHEIDQWLVPSSDGKVRLVRTTWRNGSSALAVKVLRTPGTGFQHKLIATDGRQVYWITDDGVMHLRTWTTHHWTAPATLPITIAHATAITAGVSEFGVAAYVTDASGALHAVSEGHDDVLADHGYATVTGLKAGDCLSPNYVYVRNYRGLLTVDRRSGTARFARHLHPGSSTGGTITPSVAVSPGGWTWATLG